MGLIYTTTYAQLSSRNGFTLPTSGRLHALVIYAQMVEETNTDSTIWPRGNLPSYAFWLFDPDTTVSTYPPVPNLTHYFRQMSGGKWWLTATIIPHLFSISSQGLHSFYAANNRLIDSVNAWLKQHPEWMAPWEIMDQWTPTGPYRPKLPKPNGKWDFVIIIYRDPSFLSWTGATGGVWMGFSRPLNNKTADNCFILSQSIESPYPINILVHEIAHGLLGGNDYHVMGAAAGGEMRYGNTIQFGLHRGWGILGGNDIFQSINAWERDRLGWHPPRARIYRITPDNTPPDGISITLRDFVTQGDAAQIRLPHTNTLPQYIWLEAHFKRSPFDKRWRSPAMLDCLQDRLPAGVYAYFQIGMDDSSLLHPQWIDFLFPISGEGNWDYEVEPHTQMLCYAGHEENILRKVRPNPLSGYNDWRYLLFDIGTPNHPQGDGQILGNRHPSNRATHGNNFCFRTPNSLALESCWTPNNPGNGGNIDIVQPYAERIGDTVLTWHSWGPEEAFTVGKVIGPNSNPTAASAHFRGHYVRKNGRYYPTPALHPIILNGLQIAIIEQDDTTFTIHVSYRNFNLHRAQRWAGNPIHIYDTFHIHAPVTIDLSGTPNACFIDSTTGHFIPPTHVIVQPHGGLIVGKGGRIIIRRNATLTIRDQALLAIQKGGRILIKGGRLRLPRGYRIPRPRGWKEWLFPSIRLQKGTIEYYDPIPDAP